MRYSGCAPWSRGNASGRSVTAVQSGSCTAPDRRCATAGAASAASISERRARASAHCRTSTQGAPSGSRHRPSLEILAHREYRAARGGVATGDRRGQAAAPSSASEQRCDQGRRQPQVHGPVERLRIDDRHQHQAIDQAGSQSDDERQCRDQQSFEREQAQHLAARHAEVAQHAELPGAHDRLRREGRGDAGEADHDRRELQQVRDREAAVEDAQAHRADLARFGELGAARVELPGEFARDVGGARAVAAATATRRCARCRR